ncbi:hypothetical protein EX30DRAFT_195061 [Ascodesmis nigricans]|uniref:Uncharacterized protein n=1 Tax=Ascodesmis nigricans TaxID=341454 RepID=A0A4V3SHU7_9PEZI|nr:hypothetical protein EX30DRAFT_195061 [Ascodesmis nigricans]
MYRTTSPAIVIRTSPLCSAASHPHSNLVKLISLRFFRRWDEKRFNRELPRAFRTHLERNFGQSLEDSPSKSQSTIWGLLPFHVVITNQRSVS